MIAIKLDSKLTTSAGDSLALHAQELYRRPGMRLVGVVELRHVERIQPAPDEDKDPGVKVRITSLEVANSEQEDTVRKAMEALYVHRTAHGTLDDDGAVELSERTLRHTGELLHAVEAARMRVGAGQWADCARRAAGVSSATVAELRHELDAVAKGLERLLRGEPTEDGEGS